MRDLWVFGYGSLLWNPGFEPEEKVEAQISGYHRSLCIYSWVHRGTRQKPGLVFGLDRGGACNGMALKVKNQEREAILQYLRERELVTNVYVEETCAARLADGRTVETLAYVVDRNHEQYCGKLGHEELLDLVLQGEGRSGRNVDYIINTVEHLRQFGIHDDVLERLVPELEKGCS